MSYKTKEQLKCNYIGEKWFEGYLQLTWKLYQLLVTQIILKENILLNDLSQIASVVEIDVRRSFQYGYTSAV